VKSLKKIRGYKKTENNILFVYKFEGGMKFERVANRATTKSMTTKEVYLVLYMNSLLKKIHKKEQKNKIVACFKEEWKKRN
jgi:hypothetical protein